MTLSDRFSPTEAPTGAPTEPPASFEAALTELESLVGQMEAGTLSLEDSLVAYQRGARLVGHCREALAAVTQQVKVLEGDLLKPFEPGGRTGG